MREWRGYCERCGDKSFSYTMSRFNTQLICGPCKKKEREHPDYQRAADAELASLKRGERNFPGIGKPKDL
jgi:hypothetical protein